MNRIDKQFIRFHQANPHIYREILKYSDQVWKTGIHKFGMGAIFERIRWDNTIQTNGAPFKLNNNYRSRYAKLVERDHPQTQGFFCVRELDPTSIFAGDYATNPHTHLWP